MRENVAHYTHAARENRDRIREARVNGPDHAPDPRMPAAGPGRSDTAPSTVHMRSVPFTHLTFHVASKT